MSAKSTAKQPTQKKSTDSPKTKGTNPQKAVKPPVVAVLGHVDHGKTSLLDKIRETNYQEKEAGGITQSIGAYQVDHKKNKITFIDTPGHAAFTAMRARGGQAADMVILVIAANEGVKPQTIESIGHAKAAGVPIILALNKIDLPTAQAMKVKQELVQHEIITEDLGGDVVAVEVSALTGEGVENLLDMIHLVAEMGELSTEENDTSSGMILEARQDPKKGILATLIIQSGTVKAGDYIVAGTSWGKIKRMTDWQGNTIQTAGPADPVEVMGFQSVPNSGEIFTIVESEKEAKTIVLEPEIKDGGHTIKKDKNVKVVPLVVKADTQGALEAFKAALEGLNTDESRVDIVYAGLSDVTEADVMLATVSDAIILGFNVGRDKAAQNAAQIERIPIMTYDIIYRALEDVSAFLESEADQLRAIGYAEVLQVFELSDGTFVAGSKVEEGNLLQGSRVQVLRDDEIVAEGRISSLRHEKDKKSKVQSGEECGIVMSPNFAFQPEDTVIAYSV
ncbi:translation initiation factor IF-2 [candidate division WWE3 bacterium]|uniref:Translation initiation factor IF-2 n=1 Tax=candidate division WWE3 bacterium TaxID=2053526 RepID=A0A955RPA7_UNCKA|nr:translation initiation factor IF-2 [candidate division WWE3 bacterium]